MYQDLKKKFWWHGMKKDIAEYVAQRHSCQLVKAKHQRLGGLLKSLAIPIWNFVVSLPKTPSGQDAI
jgi:hypothetical protein